MDIKNQIRYDVALIGLSTDHITTGDWHGGIYNAIFDLSWGITLVDSGYEGSELQDTIERMWAEIVLQTPVPLQMLLLLL